MSFWSRLFRRKPEPYQFGDLPVECCETCKFWQVGLNGFGIAGSNCSGSHSRCRRFAPIVDPSPPGSAFISGNASWPYTAKADWCGEYQQREA